MGGSGSGGRRRGAQRAQLDACAPPPPPRGLSAEERQVWKELAAQVTAARTYTLARLSAFRLTVKALTLAYWPPPDTKPGSVHQLIRTASAMLARFGLDSLSANAADAAPAAPSKRESELARLIGEAPAGEPTPTLRDRADQLRRESGNPPEQP